MVRRGLGGDRHTVGLGSTHQLDAALGRQMQEVDSGTRQPGQLDVAMDHQLLGDARPTRDRPSRLQHSPSCMTAPSVRRATSQCWASVMPSPSEYSSARRISSGSCTPLPSSVNNLTPAAASSANGASCWPRRPTVMQPAGRHLAEAGRHRLAAHELDDADRVLGGIGVRHRHDRRVPTERRRPRAGLDRLGLLVARLAQMGVEVDEAGAHDAPRGVEHGRRRRDRRRRRRRRNRRSTRRPCARRPGRARARP